MSIARRTHHFVADGHSRLRNVCLAAIAGVWLLVAGNVQADGCFVFHWDKQKDINEPAQKAIILHDNGQEDLVLQVKYEGPAEDFGWLIPVPGLPEVRRGSMDCFYELSQITQLAFVGAHGASTQRTRGIKSGEDASVKVIEVKTVGAYEVTVLSATNSARLGEWLDDHHFIFSKEKQNILDDYVKRRWYFVAAKIDPNEDGFMVMRGDLKKSSDKTAISHSVQQQLANGDLHPLVISFPSERCVFPLAISAVNGKPSEVALYVLSSEPLINRIIFDRRLAAYNQQRSDWIRQAPERQKSNEENRKGGFSENVIQAEVRAQMRKRPKRFLPSSYPTPSEVEKMIADLSKVPPRVDADFSRFFPFSPMGDDDPSDPKPSPQLLWREDRLERILTDFEAEFRGGGDLMQSMELNAEDIPACSKEMPRLAGRKSWWLTKQVEVFTPEDMRDLEFEPAVRLLTGNLGTDDGEGSALCLSQLGSCAVPALLSALRSSNPVERRQAAFAMGGYEIFKRPMTDARLEAVVPGLLVDADARIRQYGCIAARMNWNAAFAPRLEELLGDGDELVRVAACQCLRDHEDACEFPVLMKMIAEDGPAACQAIFLVGYNLSTNQLVHLFASTNLPVISFAFRTLVSYNNYNPNLNEIDPLLTNSLVMARMMGLEALVQIGDKGAIDRIVAMLRDPNEGLQWYARAWLRYLTGQKIGPAPADWEKWWAKNKDFTPH